MSFIFDKLKSFPVLEPMQEDADFFVGRDSEGERYLFFHHKELDLMMGCVATFYKSGVLLSLDEKNKTENSQEQSFRFYNRNGKKVFNFQNFSSYNSGRTTPEEVIDIKVRESNLEILKTNLKTGETDNYFVGIEKGNAYHDLSENLKQDELTL